MTATATRATHRKEAHASPGYAPVVGRGQTKTPQLSPERVKELMDEQARLVEARHAEEKMTRVWNEDRKPKGAPSDRRLSSYTRDETRVLECRLAVLRRAGVRDPEASRALDVAMEDLDELAGMAGML